MASALRLFACAAWTGVCLVLSALTFVIPFAIDLTLRVGYALWAPVLVRLAGGRIEVTGAVDQLPRGRGFVLVSNHQGLLDVPATWAGLRLPIRFVAKRELLWIPLFNLYLLRTGCPIVNRRDRAHALRSLERAGEQVRDRRIPILVYAEGTRTRDGKVGEFKLGAFGLALNSGVPIVPVRITGSFEVLNRNSLRMTPGPIRLEVFPPIETTGLSFDDRHALAERARALIAGDGETLALR